MQEKWDPTLCDGDLDMLSSENRRMIKLVHKRLKLPPTEDLADQCHAITRYVSALQQEQSHIPKWLKAVAVLATAFLTTTSSLIESVAAPPLVAVRRGGGELIPQEVYLTPHSSTPQEVAYSVF